MVPNCWVGCRVLWVPTERGLSESSFDTVIDKSVLDTFACGAMAEANSGLVTWSSNISSEFEAHWSWYVWNMQCSSFQREFDLDGSSCFRRNATKTYENNSTELTNKTRTSTTWLVERKFKREKVGSLPETELRWSRFGCHQQVPPGGLEMDSNQSHPLTFNDWRDISVHQYWIWSQDVVFGCLRNCLAKLGQDSGMLVKHGQT